MKKTDFYASSLPWEYTGFVLRKAEGTTKREGLSLGTHIAVPDTTYVQMFDARGDYQCRRNRA
jgi:hypothetical protein